MEVSRHTLRFYLISYSNIKFGGLGCVAGLPGPLGWRHSRTVCVCILRTWICYSGMAIQWSA